MQNSLIPLFNPLSDDFTCTYDINGDKNPVTYEIKSKTVGRFEPIVANHIKKHLAEAIFEVRGKRTIAKHLQMEEIYKEIEDFNSE